jgi:hypothetical protein
MLDPISVFVLVKGKGVDQLTWFDFTTARSTFVKGLHRLLIASVQSCVGDKLTITRRISEPAVANCDESGSIGAGEAANRSCNVV